MTLIPVYFCIDGESSKALVKEDKIDFYFKLGAKRTPYEAKGKTKEIPVKETTPIEPEIVPKKTKAVAGDKGSGEPSSLRFHELKIGEMVTFESMRDYTFKVTGKTIRKKVGGTIEQYQKNSLRLLRRHFNGCQSG